MTRYDELKIELSATSRTWLVTGVAGFIGSHLLETLLRFGQRVVGLDNFATGHRRNLDEVRGLVSEEQWRDFRFIEGDIRDKLTCQQAMRFTPVDETFSTTISGEDVGEYSNTPIGYVLHQAALGSVPRSIEDPATTHDVNVNGFVNMLIAARDAGVRRFVYASSSSVYGDEPDLPKQEKTAPADRSALRADQAHQ